MRYIFNIKSFKCRNLFPQSLLIFLLFSIFSCNSAPTYNAEYIYDLGKRIHKSINNKQEASISYAEATCLYDLAANLGHAEAQYRMGMELLNKYYDTINAKTGGNFFTRLGKGFSALIMRMTGEVWLRLAANQGHAKAKHDLGMMLYNSGQDEYANKNYRQAHTWFSLSASNGNKLAIKRRDNFVTSLDSTQLEIYNKNESENQNLFAEYLQGLSYLEDIQNKKSTKMSLMFEQYVAQGLPKVDESEQLSQLKQSIQKLPEPDKSEQLSQFEQTAQQLHKLNKQKFLCLEFTRFTEEIGGETVK